MLFRSQSLRNFVDALMMFGATIEPRETKAVLRVSRVLDHRRLLSWVVLLLETHDFKTHLCDTSNDRMIIYRTDPTSFLLCEWVRWYIGGPHVPEDIEMSNELLTVWAVASLAVANHEGREDGKVLFATKDCNAVVAHWLAESANALWSNVGMHLRVERDGIFMQKECRDQIEAYMTKIVPRAVWSPGVAVC